jgi:hypothetical protein
MYTKVEETIDSKNNLIKRGDIVEVINHPFLMKNEIGITGKIIDIERYEDHFSYVDSRGEDEGITFTNVIFKTDEGYVRRLKGEFLIKIN